MDSDLCTGNPKESTNRLTQEVCPAVNPGSHNLILGTRPFWKRIIYYGFILFVNKFLYLRRASCERSLKFYEGISPLLWKQSSIFMERFKCMGQLKKIGSAGISACRSHQRDLINLSKPLRCKQAGMPALPQKKEASRVGASFCWWLRVLVGSYLQTNNCEIRFHRSSAQIRGGNAVQKRPKCPGRLFRYFHCPGLFIRGLALFAQDLLFGLLVKNVNALMNSEE